MNANNVLTFARLFGAATESVTSGEGVTTLTVSNTDKLFFNDAYNNPGAAYSADFNYTASGESAVGNTDKLQFNKRFNVTYTY
jgi:hypothetical protein